MKDSLAIDFAVWYSGMDRGKVERAFLRYKSEVIQEQKKEPYTCKLDGGKDNCIFKSKDYFYIR